MKKLGMLFVMCGILLAIGGAGPLIGRGWILLWTGQITKRLLPIASYGEDSCGYNAFLPLYCYAEEDAIGGEKEREKKEWKEDKEDKEWNEWKKPAVGEKLFLFLENQKKLMKNRINTEEDQNNHDEDYRIMKKDMFEERDWGQNMEMGGNYTEIQRNSFMPHDKMQEIDPTIFHDFEKLVRDFYVIDNNTMAGKELLDAETFLGKDFRVEKGTEEPQILIYHTHSLEEFADSEPGNEMQTVVGVGERLTEILQEEYGYNVMHHTGKYDTVRDKAYAKSLPALEEILEQYPSIKVVIDLHRDAVPEDQKLVMDLDGRPTARFMFFNGLSRTTKTGEITYLKNENLEDNLAFSFRMQKAAMEYYPGLSRKIYLKGYRYNMHLKPMSLLIELGAQNNTLEEAMNACDPLAHILDLVIGADAGAE